MNTPTDNDIRVEYFDFEREFLADNIRCIPMIVRFKLDACGIKLKLKEWSKMNLQERENLATFSVGSSEDLGAYRDYVVKTIAHYTGEKPTVLTQEQQNAAGATADEIPGDVSQKLQELNKTITLGDWKSLGQLKRYALLKLSRPGHENKNFPKALKEFGLD